jgi:hypothetical protein
MAIMGFCAIYQFDFIVERLGAEATLFVNRVAGLVHENVALWKGACNKNLGRCWGGGARGCPDLGEGKEALLPGR